MASTRQQVELVLDQVAASLDGLERPVLNKVFPVLERAHQEIERDLRMWRIRHSGGDTFTAARYHNVMGSLRSGLKMLEHSGVVIEAALKDEFKNRLAAKAANNFRYEWERLGRIYEGIVQPIPLQEAALLADGKKLLWPQFKSSAQRYAANIGERTKFHLAVSRARAETIDELTNRLERHLPDVFRGNRWDAERLGRTECLTGDTLVDRAVVRAVFRRWYDGPVVEIVTSRGRKFTTTPNHPMLTRRGWICANAIANGDHLICDGRNENLRPSGDEHVARCPSKIGEIFDSLSAVGVGERIATAKPDFHGDGTDGDVDILRPNGLLKFGNFAPLYKPSIEQVFSPSDLSASAFCGLCGRLLSQQRNPCLCSVSHADAHFEQALSRGISTQSASLANFFGAYSGFIQRLHLGVLDIFSPFPRFATAGMEDVSGLGEASCCSGLSEHLVYPSEAVPCFASNLRSTEPASIEFDCVLSVSVRQFSGHVFNLSTPYGYFTINGVYTGNTISAYNEGHRLAVEQAHEEDPTIRERWDATYDFRRCPMCASLDGQVIDPTKGEKYVARWFTASRKRGVKQLVLSISNAPAHPNCRCSTSVWREAWAKYARTQTPQERLPAAA